MFCSLELRELVDLHSKTVHDTENEDPLTYDEALIIKVCCDVLVTGH